jgi:hypothetical protein
MTEMKKIYSILLIALAVFTGCQKWIEEDPIAKVGTVDPSITTSAVSDSSFTATISGVDGVTYYSYAVLKGDKTDVNATKLFQKGLGSDYAEGVVNYADKPSTTIVLKDLIPNTKYTVYAIAGNSQSFTGNVVTATVLTSDGLTPDITKFSASDSVFTITYNEPVQKGEGAITAYVMAKNISWTEPLDSFEVPADSISIKGSVVTVTVPDAPAGAYVVLGFGEGVVKNMVGTPSEGYCALMEGAYDDWDEEDFEEDGYEYDVYTHITNDSWSFSWKDENEEGDTLIYIGPAEWAETMVPFDLERVAFADGEALEENDYPVRVTYTEGGKISSIPVDYMFNQSMDMMAFVLPEPIDVLGTISFSIEEATVEDMFGNPNKAFSRENAYMCLLISTGIEGVYQFTCDAARGVSSGNVIFKENEDGSFAVYGLSGYFAAYGFLGPVTATVNEDGDELTIASDQMYYSAGSVKFYGAEIGDDSITPIDNAKISVLENGCLTMDTDWGLADDEGWWDYAFGGYLFVKISNEVPEASATSASIPSVNLQPISFRK